MTWPMDLSILICRKFKELEDNSFRTSSFCLPMFIVLRSLMDSFRVDFMHINMLCVWVLKQLIPQILTLSISETAMLLNSLFVLSWAVSMLGIESISSSSSVGSVAFSTHSPSKPLPRSPVGSSFLL